MIALTQMRIALVQTRINIQFLKKEQNYCKLLSDNGIYEINVIVAVHGRRYVKITTQSKYKLECYFKTTYRIGSRIRVSN